MAETKTVDRPSIRRHKRQLAWQILVPFFIVLAVIVAAAVLAGIGVLGKQRVLANVAIIWMVAPALLIALLGLAVLVGLIYALARLNRGIPRYSGQVQSFFSQIQGGTARITDVAAKPVVWVSQAIAAVRSIFSRR